MPFPFVNAEHSIGVSPPLFKMEGLLQRTYIDKLHTKYSHHPEGPSRLRKLPRISRDIIINFQNSRRPSCTNKSHHWSFARVSEERLMSRWAQTRTITTLSETLSIVWRKSSRRMLPCMMPLGPRQLPKICMMRQTSEIRQIAGNHIPISYFTL